LVSKDYPQSLFCGVQKLFRIKIHADVTKLTDKKIRFICRHAVDERDWTIGRLARHYGVSIRRIQQLVKEYKQTGKYPHLNPGRRPKGKPLTDTEKEIIDQVWEETRFGARLLFYELKRRGYHIPHHKINKYLLKKKRTIPNPNKQKKRKRCRYERDHSFSLIHGDWHRTSVDHPHAIVWMDDASRYIFYGAEYAEATAEHSIETFLKVIEQSHLFNAFIKDVNTDQGESVFTQIIQIVFQNSRDSWKKTVSIIFLPDVITLKRMEKWNDSGMNMINIDGVLKPLKNSFNGIITDYMVRYG